MTKQELLATCAGGIIFTGQSVLDVGSGKKTQTRRPMKPQPSATGDNGGVLREIVPSLVRACGFDVRYELDNTRVIVPRYLPGKRYYVKETWCGANGAIFYRADGHDVRLVDGDEYGVYRNDGSEASPWKSSLHMPRSAARYVVEIDTATPQRLQDITEEDAIAEGAQARTWTRPTDDTVRTGWNCDWSRLGQISRFAGGVHPRGYGQPLTEDDICLSTARWAFCSAWDRMHGEGAWARNDFVWCYSFHVVKP